MGIRDFRLHFATKFQTIHLRHHNVAYYDIYVFLRKHLKCFTTIGSPQHTEPFSIKQLHMQIENLLKLRQSFHKLMVSLAGDTVAVSTTDFAMSQKDCEFIAKIQGVIAEQLADENFSIDTLSEQMNMSRSNFYRKIKALSGMSPNDYLKTLRMNRAAELIMGGTRISEVAVQVGFTSSSYFAKCFKAQYGV